MPSAADSTIEPTAAAGRIGVPVRAVRLRPASLWGACALSGIVAASALGALGCAGSGDVPADDGGSMSYPTRDGTGWTRAGDSGQAAGEPCLDIDTTLVDFGTLPVGASRFATLGLVSCGSGDVTITQLAIGSEEHSAGGGFRLDCSLLLGGECPTPAAPLVLPPEAHATIRLYFEPATTHDAEVADSVLASLHIVSDAGEEPVAIPLAGTAVGATCPVASLAWVTGDDPVPGDVLELSAQESFSPNGALVAYHWMLQSPTGVTVALEAPDGGPLTTASVVSLPTQLAGTYKVTLSVTDDTGKHSCLAAQALLDLEPPSDLYVELLWEPAGTGEGAGRAPGRDLDLHLLHPHAEGPDRDGDGVADGWFDTQWDCFWFTPDPGWAEQLAQSVDGAGPEAVHVPSPTDGSVYRIGVHYWDDHGRGPAAARLKIWVFRELARDVAGLTLAPGDLWQAATIHWPGGEVTLGASGGAFDVIPDYPVPAHYLD